MPPEIVVTMNERQFNQMIRNDRPCRSRRQLYMWNCTFCRKDKKKCEPQGRKWPQKCGRCVDKGLCCSVPVRKHRKRKDDTVNSMNMINDNEDNANFHVRPLNNVAYVAEPNALSQESEPLPWDFKDLSNALGILQLVAAEYVEQEGASYEARSIFPRHHLLVYRSFHDRVATLIKLLNVFQHKIELEVISRLENEPDPNGKQILEEALNTLADPLSGILMNYTMPPPYIDQRPRRLQFPSMAESLHQRATALLADGQIFQSLIYYHKSISYGKRQPDSHLSSTFKHYDIPKIMAITVAKFGLDGDYTTRDFWTSPSLIHPSFLPRSRIEAMQTALIKNWIGFNDSSSLIGNKMLGSGSPNDWKRVFRQMCRAPTGSKTGPDGRTSLHLAVLLGMIDEVELLCRSPKLDITKTDIHQRTALHLAAIIGNETICDALLLFGHAGNSMIMIKDCDDRLPVWYAADRNREEDIYKKLMSATLQYESFDGICSERDKDGKNLAEYGMAHGMAQAEFLKLVASSEFPNSNHLRPDLYPIKFQNWQEQVSYPLGNILSPWNV